MGERVSEVVAYVHPNKKKQRNVTIVGGRAVHLQKSTYQSRDHFPQRLQNI